MYKTRHLSKKKSLILKIRLKLDYNNEIITYNFYKIVFSNCIFIKENNIKMISLFYIFYSLHS